MGFINNHKDNFLPSNSPWGDDNVTVYNYKNNAPMSFDVSSMDYDNLQETFREMKDDYNSLPPCPAKNRLKSKMKVVTEELRKRNSFEEIARRDRDDNFEIPPRRIKEDVIVPTPPINEIFDNVEEPTTPIEVPKVESDLSDEVLQDMLEEIEDDEVDEVKEEKIVIKQGSLSNSKEMDNFLIASLIVITLIAITKK